MPGSAAYGRMLRLHPDKVRRYLEVSCPTCDAAIGIECTTGEGKITARHVARLEAIIRKILADEKEERRNACASETRSPVPAA